MAEPPVSQLRELSRVHVCASAPVSHSCPHSCHCGLLIEHASDRGWDHYRRDPATPACFSGAREGAGAAEHSGSDPFGVGTKACLHWVVASTLIVVMPSVSLVPLNPVLMARCTAPVNSWPPLPHNQVDSVWPPCRPTADPSGPGPLLDAGTPAAWLQASSNSPPKRSSPQIRCPEKPVRLLMGSWGRGVSGIRAVAAGSPTIGVGTGLSNWR